MANLSIELRYSDNRGIIVLLNFASAHSHSTPLIGIGSLLDIRLSLSKLLFDGWQ